MSTSEIIALCGLLISGIVLLVNSRRDTRTSAADQARVEAKLNGIATGVDDIRVEQRAMRERVDGLAEKVSAVESSVKSAHHRIDTMENRIEKGE